MFLIVGLGNPGAEYAATRHNAGFMVVDALAVEYGFCSWRDKFDGQVAEGQIGGEKVYLLKPHTFMNLSGNSVVKAAAFYKIPLEKVVVIHDDMDLDVTQIKAKTGGGSGGHNGLKSIDAHITNGYHRIRLGVGHPKGGEEEVVNYVLSHFSKAERLSFDRNIEIVVKNIDVLLKYGMSAFSNKIGMLLHKLN